ncbi:hypothetical protein O2N63_05885 [Aliiroseovarius sp. KMU-50]|uniref:AB hydrolase-1 domain-containing protein n=1 Tax=Aliiroseovarius salicola TaxID=3009082 RepID=A0ABT4W1B7_9RHOB|nr:alpha/beta fold hydrolase [Aliiroseovarius sp. KMU-50]MDA5093617.1 hypothetical protein [Aliiroseovarius sp. KMU-50]
MREEQLDGLVLWVSEARRPGPCFLFFPGSIGNLDDRAWKLNWFAEKGYGVVAMGYPGSSGSKGRASSTAIMRAAHKTWKAVPSLLGECPVVVVGASLGSGVATRLSYELTQKGTPPAGLVLQAPYRSIHALVSHQAPSLAPFFRGNFDPWPTERFIKHLKLPLFIMHGGRDTAVPVAQGRAVFKTSPSKNKQLEIRKKLSHGKIWAGKGVLKKMERWSKDLQ